MYLVDIYDSENRCAVGPDWFTDAAEGPTLQQALEEAKNWIEESEEPERYQVMYRIVGCL